MRSYNDQTGSELFNSGAQLSRGPARCTFYKRWGDTQEQSRDKFASLQPKQFSSWIDDNKNCVLVAETKAEASTSQENIICVLARNSSLSVRWINKSNESLGNASSLIWFIDFGASSHKTPELSSFSKLEYTEPFPVEMGDKLTVETKVHGDVELSINVLGNAIKCLIQYFLYAPEVRLPSYRWEHLGGVV